MEPNIIQENNNPPVQSTPPIMPKQKKQVPTWLGFVIIVIFIVVLFGGVFAYQYFFVKPSVVVEAPQVQSPTAGWKTYTNTQYGFEIKYPANTNLELNENDISQYNLLFDANINFHGNENKTCATYNLSVAKTNYFDINKWVEKNKNEIETPSNYEGEMISEKISSVESVDINGALGKKIIVNNKKSIFPFNNERFGVISNNNIYVINYSFLPEEGKCPMKIEDYNKIFEQIISTFKFIK